MKDREKFEQINIFGTGEPNTGFARYFTGESFLNPLTDPKSCPLFLANVTFEPGCQNNWHIHHASKGGGQVLPGFKPLAQQDIEKIFEMCL